MTCSEPSRRWTGRGRRHPARRRALRLLAPAAALVLSAALQGCDGRPGSRPEPPPPRAPAGSVVARLESNQAGLLTKAESDRMARDAVARNQQAIADCMRRNGFAYTPADPASLFDAVTETDFSSLAYARHYGFGISSVPRFAPDTSGNDRYADTLPPDRQAVYRTSLTGCANEADAAQENDPDARRADARFTAVDALVRDDPRYLDAARTWSACAASAGHPATDRDALIDTLRREFASLTQAQGGGSAPATPESARDPAHRAFLAEEIRAAVATFPCSHARDAVYADVYRDVDDRLP